jgi:hypothetical protein
MIRRFFWFALGAGLALFVYVKIRGYLKRATPSALGSRVADSASDVGGRAQDFVGRVRAAMSEREAELREVFDERGADAHRFDVPE